MAYVERPDGARIHYEVAGDPARPALVLLEGMGGDIPGWRRNVPHLAAEAFVVAFDHRGNGRSWAPDAPTTMRTYVDDCLAVIDELAIGWAHVYGQSFGGMVAQELALTHPERLRCLILACTHPGPMRAVPARARVPKDRPWLQLYSPAFARAHPEHVEEDLRVGRAQPQDPQGQRRQWEAMQAWDAFERLPQVGAPTLVLHGSDDRMVDVENARVLASRIPGAELLILQGAGHVYHSEQPEAADEAVLGFLRRHPG